MKSPIHRHTFTALGLLACVTLSACGTPDEVVVGCRDLPDLDSNCPTSSSWEAEWKEAGVPPPALPAAADLVPIDAPNGKAGYEYLVDDRSVSRGEDGVMRYTIVVRSPTGAENVFFEGVRCATNQVRTYAYASSGGEFRPVTGSWGPVAARGVRGYQDYLLERVMCDPHGYPWDPEHVVEVLRSQYTAGGVRIKRFCGNLGDCNTTGRRF